MDSNKSVTAVFTLITYNLTVSTAGTGSGTVTANASNPLDRGSVVLLSATPAADSIFTGWSGDLSGTTNPATITMDSNKSVTAVFMITPITFEYNIDYGNVTLLLSYGNTTYQQTQPTAGGTVNISFGGAVVNNSRTFTMKATSFSMTPIFFPNFGFPFPGLGLSLTLNLDRDSVGTLYTAGGTGDVDVSSLTTAGQDPSTVTTIGDGTPDAAGSELSPVMLNGTAYTVLGSRYSKIAQLALTGYMTTGESKNQVLDPAHPASVFNGSTVMSSGIPFAQTGGPYPYVGTSGKLVMTVALIGEESFQVVIELDLSPKTTITWSNPADIVYGTALDGTQLNAVSSALGSLVYTPAAGTVLNAGNNQELRADFTPNDTTNYSSASKTITINVIKADQTITFNTLPVKSYGDADFAPDATASSGLTVSYSSSNTSVATIVSGNIHIVGAGTATITSSQAGDSNYNAALNVDQTLTVNKKTITVTADPQTKVYGTSDPLSLTYTNDPLIVGDSFTGALTRDAGEAAGSYAITIGDLSTGSNYDLIYIGANLTISQATTTITWDNQADIVYGTALDDTQLNAVSSVPGSFVYTPAAGTVLNAGNDQELRADFTPTDTTNYSSASKTVTINVTEAAPTVTSISPASGPTAGGTSITIAGTGFISGATVTIGGNDASDVSVSATSITATTPAGAEGPQDVVVTNPDIQSDTLIGGFTYVP